MAGLGGYDPQITGDACVQLVQAKLKRGSQKHKEWNTVLKTLMLLDRSVEQYVQLEAIEKIGCKQFSKFYSPFEEISTSLSLPI